MALTFRPPASPRSAVTRMSNRFLIGRSVRNGCGDPVVRLATSVSTSAIRSAYGRAASALICTRRSLDAATACIARVICWVFFRLAIRRRISARVARPIPPSRSLVRWPGEPTVPVLREGEGLVLILLEQLRHPLAAFEIVPSAFVEIGRVLGEGGELPLLV